MKQLPDAYREFERFCKHKGLRIVSRGDSKYGEIFIAETDKEVDLLRFPEYPNGFYQVCWAFAGKTSGGKLDVASWVEFDALHDLHWSDRQRREGRINVAKQMAVSFIEQNIQAARIHNPRMTH